MLLSRTTDQHDILLLRKFSRFRVLQPNTKLEIYLFPEKFEQRLDSLTIIFLCPCYKVIFPHLYLDNILGLCCDALDLSTCNCGLVNKQAETISKWNNQGWHLTAWHIFHTSYCDQLFMFMLSKSWHWLSLATAKIVDFYLWWKMLFLSDYMKS